MNKFTLFTILFSLSLMIVIADLVIRDYVASKSAQSSVLTAEQPIAQPAAPEVLEPTENLAPIVIKDLAQPAVDNPDAPLETFTAIEDTPPVTTTAPFDGILDERLLGNSGFNDAVRISFDGKLFQLFDVESPAMRGEGAALFQVYDTADDPVGIFLELAFRDEISSQQMYDFIKNKSRVYIDLSVNETNTYGSRSFFINHVKKPDEVFLVVKEGKYVYAFAHLKTFHSKVKTLISLLQTSILDQQFSN